MNTLLFNLLLIHLTSLTVHGISTLISAIFGLTYEAWSYCCLILNATVECWLILLMLNLSFGWKTIHKEQLFASQILYKIVLYICWIILSILERARDDSGYIRYLLFSVKAIVFMMCFYGSYHTKNRHQKHSIQFHHRLLIYALGYLLSSFI